MEEPEEKPVDPSVLKCTLDLLPLSPCVVGTLRKTFFFSHAQRSLVPSPTPSATLGLVYPS